MKIIGPLLFVLSFVLFISSCKKTEEDKSATMVLNFKHQINNSEIVFDEIKYTNSFGNNYSVSTLKYFISNVNLKKSDGSMVLLSDYIYIDGADNTTSSISIVDLALGDYESISFVFGLNEEDNISNKFLNPPENNMVWPEPMGGGYHYMKLEGKFDSTDLVKNYQAHTGRLMENPHFINIDLKFDAPFSLVSNEDIILNLVMDINLWWTAPNNIDLNEMSGIMGNESKQQLLMENGANVFSIN